MDDPAALAERYIRVLMGEEQGFVTIIEEVQLLRHGGGLGFLILGLLLLYGGQDLAVYIRHLDSHGNLE